MTVIDLRQRIDEYLRSIAGRMNKGETAKTYLENLGHEFKCISLPSSPYAFSLGEGEDGEVWYRDARGKRAIFESEAPMILEMIGTFKNDLIL